MSRPAVFFEPLKKAIPKGQVLFPGSPGYEESLHRWSEACVKRAAVVVKPADTEETSAAVRFATSTHLPLAVCAGGHSTRGASSSEGGMVIDLSLMRSIEIDPSSRTVVIGGGCLGKHIDAAVAPYGLVAVTAAESTCGYGGYVLGGGYSYLTPMYGLGCDNLVEVEVVLADGSIVVASEAEDSDLFWALHGAGANFGVCTKFKSRLFEQGDVWAGIMVFGMDKVPDIVAFANYMHENHDGRPYLNFGCTAMAPAYEPAMACQVFYNGTGEEAEAYYKPLLDAAPVFSSAKTVSWAEANTATQDLFGVPRKVQGSANFVAPLKVENVQEACDEFFAFVQERNMLNGSVIAWELVPNDKVQVLDNTATAFAARGKAYRIATILQWNDPALDQEVRDFNEKLDALLRKTGIGKGVQQYLNYDGVDLTPEEAYGENLGRLQALKRKYDPTNVFHKWHPIFPTPATT